MEFNLETFFFDTPIYTQVEIEDTSSTEFLSLFILYYPARDLEGYNPWKKVQSTFRISRALGYNDSKFIEKGGIEKIVLNCKRYQDEFEYYVLWSPEEKILYKVGQFPSVADFHISEIKK